MQKKICRKKSMRLNIFYYAILIFLLTVNISYAQEHNLSNTNSDCKLLKDRCSRGEGCSVCYACQKNDNQERQARAAEDKRVEEERARQYQQILLAKAEELKQQREAVEREQRQQAEEEKKRQKEKQEADELMKKYAGIAAKGKVVSADSKSEAAKASELKLEMFEDRQNKTYGFKIDGKIISKKTTENGFYLSRIGESDLFILRIDIEDKNSPIYRRDYETIFSIINYKCEPISINGISEFSIIFSKENEIVFFKNKEAEEFIKVACSGCSENDFYQDKESAVACIKSIRNYNYCVGYRYFVAATTYIRANQQMKVIDVKDGYKTISKHY